MLTINSDFIHGPYKTELNKFRIEAFCDVVGIQPTKEVPISYLAMLAWAVQWDAFSAIPSEVMNAAGARVHGEHEIRLHSPLQPGQWLDTTSQLTGVRPNRAGAVVTQRIEHQIDGHVVAEQWWSLFLGGVQLKAVGDAAPDHLFPEDARANHLRTVVVPISARMARDYAAVSGDWADHHFDAESAARSGAAAPFLHGLCTFAICANAASDGRSLKRVAARFAAPAILDNDINVDVFSIGSAGHVFEASCAGAKIASNGVVEFR